jgi:hypothetical protein
MVYCKVWLTSFLCIRTCSLKNHVLFLDMYLTTMCRPSQDIAHSYAIDYFAWYVHGYSGYLFLNIINRSHFIGQDFENDSSSTSINTVRTSSGANFAPISASYGHLSSEIATLVTCLLESTRSLPLFRKEPMTFEHGQWLRIYSRSGQNSWLISPSLTQCLVQYHLIWGWESLQRGNAGPR